MKAEKPKPLTRYEAAQQTGLSVRTIDRLIAEKVLVARKYKRAVRIDGESFQKYQERACTTACA